MSDAVFDQEERAFLENRNRVSDEEIVARMNAAPDLGGALLVVLSEFVSGRMPTQRPNGENDDTEV